MGSESKRSKSRRTTEWHAVYSARPAPPPSLRRRRRHSHRGLWPPMLLLRLHRRTQYSGGAIAAPPAANIRSKQRADNNSLSELSLSLAASLQAAGIHTLTVAVVAPSAAAAMPPHAYKPSERRWESFFVLPSTRFDTTTKHSPTLPFYGTSTIVSGCQCAGCFSWKHQLLSQRAWIRMFHTEKQHRHALPGWRNQQNV